MRKRLALWLLAAAVLQGGCSGEKAATKTPIRIGFVTWIGYGPLYVAQAKGLFAKHGLDVNLIRIEGDPERKAAIASGNLDGCAYTLDAMIVLRSQGVPVKTVMAIDASTGGDGIVATKEFKTIDDLRGAQIAFPTGVPSHFFLYSVLKAHGIPMTAITPLVMDADKAGSSFAAGKVKVAVTWEPWLSKAEKIAGGHILIDSSKEPGHIEDVLFLREDVIKNRPKDVAALVQSWYDAVDYMKSHADECNQIISKELGIPLTDLTGQLTKIRIEGRDGNATAFGTAEHRGFMYDLYDRISEAWVEEKVIPGRDRPEDGVDPSFVRGVQSQ